MRSKKKLASRFAAVVAMTALVGASAFAESRPSNETRGRRSGSNVEVRGGRVEGNRASGGRIERDRSQTRSNRNDGAYRSPSQSSRNSGRNDSSRNGSYRDNSRSRNDSSRNGSYRDNNRSRPSTSTSRNDSRYGQYRNDGYRNNSSSRNRSYGTSRYDNRSRYYHSGRVSRVNPYAGGYRIWLSGCSYPFFIPSAYYHRDRFRLGVTIALGGYYNARGYYDYYDDYDNDRYYDVSTSRGEMRGVVESVDYRRQTFVVRNEATGSFVTVAMRDRGRDPVRAGDLVTLGGDWTRNGVFEAYRVEILETSRRED